MLNQPKKTKCTVISYGCPETPTAVINGYWNCLGKRCSLNCEPGYYGPQIKATCRQEKGSNSDSWFIKKPDSAVCKKCSNKPPAVENGKWRCNKKMPKTCTLKGIGCKSKASCKRGEWRFRVRGTCQAKS